MTAGMRELFRRLFSSRRNDQPTPPLAGPIEPATQAPVAHPVATGKTMTAAEIEERFHRCVLGVEPAAGDAPGPTEQATFKRLREAFGGERFDVGKLPRLPAVIPQLLRSLKNDDVDSRQLSEQIGHDPVLVGEIIRVANTAHYRTGKPIASLAQAILMLGHEGLRRVVMQLVMRPILRTDTGRLGRVAGPRLWGHAERCAIACTILGKDGCDPFEAYLAGIVCNTGAIAVIGVIDQEGGDTDVPHSTRFLRTYAQWGDRLSLHAARHWQFPERVQQALAERADPADTGAKTPLGRVLQTANRLAMLEVLVEHGQVDEDTGLAEHRFSADLLARCRERLRQEVAPQDA
jgi:HD-like signal output (HDOD) protein